MKVALASLAALWIVGCLCGFGQLGPEFPSGNADEDQIRLQSMAAMAIKPYLSNPLSILRVTEAQLHDEFSVHLDAKRWAAFGWVDDRFDEETEHHYVYYQVILRQTGPDWTDLTPEQVWLGEHAIGMQRMR